MLRGPLSSAKVLSLPAVRRSDRVSHNSEGKAVSEEGCRLLWCESCRGF